LVDFDFGLSGMVGLFERQVVRERRMNRWLFFLAIVAVVAAVYYRSDLYSYLTRGKVASTVTNAINRNAVERPVVDNTPSLTLDTPIGYNQ
jgi:hypothetical protein